MMNASLLIAVGRPRGWGNLVNRTATLVALRNGSQIEGPVSTDSRRCGSSSRYSPPGCLA